MKANSDKSHLLLNCSEPPTVLIDGSSIKSNKRKILLGIIVETWNLMAISIIFVKIHVNNLML